VNSYYSFPAFVAVPAAVAWADCADPVPIPYGGGLSSGLADFFMRTMREDDSDESDGGPVAGIRQFFNQGQ